MNDPALLLRAFRQVTRLGEGEESLLLRRLEERGVLGGSVPSLLQNLPEPEGCPSVDDVLRAGQRRPLLPPRRFAVLVAAAVTIAIVLWNAAFRPEPALEATLVSQPAWQESQPVGGLDLSWQGFGTVSGTESAPRVDWDRGTLQISLAHGRVTELSVVTREARVHVTGTKLSVSRNGFETRVAVTEGTVFVSCHDGTEALVAAGDLRTCGPVGAAAFLGLARQQWEEKNSADVVLGTVRTGLAETDPGSAVAVELHVLEIELLSAAGRPDEALSTARALLASGAGSRREQVERVVSELEAAVDQGNAKE
jgi:hypothetical protein